MMFYIALESFKKLSDFVVIGVKDVREIFA